NKSDVNKFCSLTPKESSGTNQNVYNLGAVNLTNTLGANKVNQVTFEAANWQNGLLPNITGPGLFFSNGVVLGQNSSFPQTTSFHKYQLRAPFSPTATGKAT